MIKTNNQTLNKKNEQAQYSILNRLKILRGVDFYFTFFFKKIVGSPYKPPEIANKV